MVEKQITEEIPAVEINLAYLERERENWLDAKHVGNLALANAIFDGRINVILEDLFVLGYGIPENVVLGSE